MLHTNIQGAFYERKEWMKITHGVKRTAVQQQSSVKVDSSFKWSEWVKTHVDDYGLCDPALDAQTAINILYEYLLPEYSERDGCGYITSMPESQDQINSIIVNELLLRYSKSYKKERQELEKMESRRTRTNFWYNFFQSIANRFKEEDNL